MRVRGKGTRHKEPISLRREDFWARVSADPLTQVPRHDAIAAVWCVVLSPSELQLSGGAGRLPGWEKWGRVGGGTFWELGEGLPPWLWGCLGVVMVQVKEAFRGPHYPQGEPSYSGFGFWTTFCLFWGPSRCYTEACWHLTPQRQKKLLATLGFPKRSPGYCEEVAQTTEGKRSHCKCRGWQRKEATHNLRVCQ